MAFRFTRHFARNLSFSKKVALAIPITAASALFMAQPKSFVAFAESKTKYDSEAAIDADYSIFENDCLPPRGPSPLCTLLRPIAPIVCCVLPICAECTSFHHNPFFFIDIGGPSAPGALDKPVKDLGLDDVEKYLMDPAKDVVVEYYSPTCPSCAGFAIILKYVAEALKEYPDITIAKINNRATYRPGLLTADQEDATPTIILYPAGSEKKHQLAENDKFLIKLKEYNASLLRQRQEERQRRLTVAEQTGTAYEELKNMDRSEFLYDRKNMPGVGIEMPMTRDGRAVHSWDMLLEWLHSNAKAKFDLEKAKQHVNSRAGDLRKEILPILADNMGPGPEVAMHSPCGSSWRAFFDEVMLNGVGASHYEEIGAARATYQQCLLDKRAEETRFWKEVQNHSEIVESVLKGELDNYIKP